MVPEPCVREVTSDDDAIFQTAAASVIVTSAVPPVSVEVPFQVPASCVVTAAPLDDTRFPFTVVPASKSSVTFVPAPAAVTSPFSTALSPSATVAADPESAVRFPVITLFPAPRR